MSSDEENPLNVTEVPESFRRALANGSSTSDSGAEPEVSLPEVSPGRLSGERFDTLLQESKTWKELLDSMFDSSSDSYETKSPDNQIGIEPGSSHPDPVSPDIPLSNEVVREVADVRDCDVSEDNSGDALSFADSETETDKWESSSSNVLPSDSELSEADKWPCHQCGNPTWAISRYCLRCFQVRRNWLPERRKSSKKQRRREKGLTEGSKSEPASSKEEVEESNEVDEDEEELESLHPPKPKRLKMDPNMSHIEKKKKKKNKISRPLSNYCDYCCIREKDAAFVHNRIAHRCCCFRCADKILKKTGKCPICRERILRVVKIVVV